MLKFFILLTIAILLVQIFLLFRENVWVLVKKLFSSKVQSLELAVAASSNVVGQGDHRPLALESRAKGRDRKWMMPATIIGFFLFCLVLEPSVLFKPTQFLFLVAFFGLALCLKDEPKPGDAHYVFQRHLPRWILMAVLSAIVAFLSGELLEIKTVQITDGFSWAIVLVIIASQIAYWLGNISILIFMAAQRGKVGATISSKIYKFAYLSFYALALMLSCYLLSQRGEFEKPLNFIALGLFLGAMYSGFTLLAAYSAVENAKFRIRSPWVAELRDLYGDN